MAKFGNVGIVPVFTLYFVQFLGLIFGWKKRKFGLMFFMKIVVEVVNLMLGFLITQIRPMVHFISGIVTA